VLKYTLDGLMQIKYQIQTSLEDYVQMLLLQGQNMDEKKLPLLKAALGGHTYMLFFSRKQKEAKFK